MSPLLPASMIRKLIAALVSAGLATTDARQALLQGIHPGFVTSLPRAGSDLDQVASDLHQLNRVLQLEGGQVPLRIWLENAVGRLTLSGRVEATQFRQALAVLDGGYGLGREAVGSLVPLRRPTAPESFAGGHSNPTPRLSPDEVRSLQNQLANLKENLRLIEERMAEYVEEIPLQLIRNRNKQLARIAEVEGKLGPSRPAPPSTGLSGQEIERLHQALTASFDFDGLTRMIRTKLNRNLQQISLGSDLDQVVFDLVSAAEREGWTGDLVKGAHAANPGSPELQALRQEMGLD